MLRKRITTAAATALVSLLAMPPANAAPLGITDTPLFLSGGVKPNLIMAIDDSGSMDAELLLRGNDGAAWWRTAASGTCTAATDNNSFVGCKNNADGSADIAVAGQLNFNNAGNASPTWKKFIYLFPNGSGNNSEDRRRYADDGNAAAPHDHYAVPPLPAYAWSRSPVYNGTYFDPSTVYTPWPSSPGFPFANANIFSTEYDPVFNGAGTLDVTREFAGIGSVNVGSTCNNATLGAVNANYGFRVFTGMTIPAGTCIRSSNPARNWETVRAGGCQVGTGTNLCLVTTSTGVNQAYTLVNNTTIGIKYFPATFFLSAASAPPASFGYTGPLTPTGLAPDGTVLNRYEIKSGNFASLTQYDAAMQNFANWFMYYRKRHLALRGGLGTAFLTLQATRVAGFTINSAGGNPPNTPDVTMLDIDTVANRTALYTNFYRNWTGNGGTPNRRAVANLIRNFKRTNTDAPITHSCQRNFGMLFTDGFSNPPEANDGINGIAGNADGTAGDPYEDGVTDTLADAVMRANSTPLRTGPLFPVNKVMVKSECNDAGHDLRIDCNNDLHMNFYAITLGAKGLQFDSDVPVDPYDLPLNSPIWPTSFPARHPSAVDDLWHATVNGHGQLLNARSGAELADKLGAVLRSIVEQVGSASSAAVNSGSINSDTRLFQASFNSEDWSGELTGRDVDPTTGTLGTEVLATLPAANSRAIIAVNSTGTAVPFRWASLDATRKGQLQPSDTLGANRLGWLRGDQTNEAPNGDDFRVRTVLLGDIINSAPAFVGAPAFRYPDTLETAPYSAFRATHLGRPHMVYTGANDGMLHGFFSDDAPDDGSGVVREELAFIPSAVFGNLHQLTSSAYTHRYFVDGTPVTGDAFFGGSWHTMLVAGLNKGGQAVYALDVTNPASFSEPNAGSIFRWEFSDVNDADLGYTYSRPSIVRMNTGVWAAAFGNGYNNTVADGHASTTGNAVLYIRNISDGTTIAKIDTGVGMADDPTLAGRPNGLSTPVFVDINGDSDVDIAYAGDLFGNLWKFDLSSATASAWGVANDEPLFVAVNGDGDHQPITSRPNVSRGPQGQGLIVLFGTGKYLEASDTVLATLDKQTFYGLLDPNSGTGSDIIAGRGDLTQQTITHEVFDVPFGATTADVRVTTNNALGSTSRGWYIDLLSPSGFQGEMQVTDSLIRNDHVVFTTLVPNTDPCEFGGSSWLMEMNLFTGARPSTTPWDLNNNERFDDTVIIGGVEYPISGVQTEVGITPKPAPLSGETCDFLIFPGTSGGTETRCRDPGPRGFGRQSWRQAH